MTVLRLPWVHLKRWIEVWAKRKRREFKREALFAGMRQVSGISGLFGGGAALPDKEMNDEERVSALKGMGYKVKTVKKE